MRVIKMVVILLGFLLMGPYCAQAASVSQLGDVSGDGTVSMYDAALVARYVQGLITLTPAQLTSADVNQVLDKNGNPVVTAADAALIAQKVMGLIQQFPSTSASYTFTTSAGLSGTIGINGISSMTLNGMTVIKPGSSWQEADAGPVNGTCPSGACITECGDNETRTAPGINLITNGPNAQCDVQGGAVWTYPYPNELSLVTDPNMRNGAPVMSTIEQVDANDFIVTHIYPNAQYTYTYNIKGEDITITTQVQNNSTGQYIYNLLFRGMGLPFASPLGDELLSRSNMESVPWDYSYLGINGRSLFHPSIWNPIGAWVLNNNFFGVSIMPMDEQGQKNIVMEDTIGHAGQDTEDRYPIYFLAQQPPIAPGASATNTLVMRFSNNINFKHLMAPYQANFTNDLPAAQYQPDVRPIAFTDEVDPSYINNNFIPGTNIPIDPLGFQIDRRLDLAPGCDPNPLMGCDNDLEMANDLVAAGGQGAIHWGPQGWSWQNSPMFTPAMDQFPSVVSNVNDPSNPQGILDKYIIPGYKNLGLKFGFEDQMDLDNTYGTWQQVDADDPKAMATTLGRFKTTTQMGAQLYYLDSFGSTINDQQIMKAIRNQVGNGVLTYTEDNSDEILPYTGFYTEFNEATVLQSAFTQAGIGGDYQVLVNNGLVNSLNSQAGVLSQGLSTIISSGKLQTLFPTDYAAVTNILQQSQNSGAPGVFYDSISLRNLAVYQWLVPQGVYVAVERAATPTATQAWTWVYQHRLTPMPFDCSIAECTSFNEEPLFQSLNAQYVDPQTHAWKASAFSPPATPANFNAQVASSTQINLSWSPISSNDYNSYVIERSLDNGTTWQKIVTLADNQANFTPTYSDSGLSPATAYTYRIKAYNDFTGESAYSSPVPATTPSN